MIVNLAGTFVNIDHIDIYNLMLSTNNQSVLHIVMESGFEDDIKGESGWMQDIESFLNTYLEAKTTKEALGWKESYDEYQKNRLPL